MCGSRPGEGEDQYGGWIDAPLFDQTADALHQYQCLPASRSGNNGTGPRPLSDGGFLCRISFLFTSVSHLCLTMI